jgi:hypothetical protein
MGFPHSGSLWENSQIGKSDNITFDILQNDIINSHNGKDDLSNLICLLPELISIFDKQI